MTVNTTGALVTKISLKAMCFDRWKIRKSHSSRSLKQKNFGWLEWGGIGNEPRTSQTRLLAMRMQTNGWVHRGWHEGTATFSGPIEVSQRQ